MKPVSVIIPAHNAARSIAATLASLGSELGVIEEILLVDDASTDDTASVAEQAGRDHRLSVRVIRVEKRNAGAARNVGIDESVAPWLYFIDSDDCHLAGGLRAMLTQGLADPHAGLVVGAAIWRSEGTDRLVNASRDYGRSRKGNAESYLADRSETINVGATLINRRTIANSRFPEHIPYEEDTLFWARLLTVGAVTVVDRTIVTYNLSRSRADDRLVRRPVQNFFVWRRVLRELTDVGISRNILARREALLAIKIARVHYLRGEFHIARRFLGLARHQPKNRKTAWRYWRYWIKLVLKSRSIQRSPAGYGRG